MIIKGPNYPCLISHTDRCDKRERYSQSTSKKCHLLVWIFWCCRAKDLYCSKQWRNSDKLFGMGKLDGKLHKKWNFPFSISLVNQTSSAKIVAQTIFLPRIYEKLQKQEKGRLSETAGDLFHSIHKFDKFHNSGDMLSYICVKVLFKILKLPLWNFPIVFLRESSGK